MKHVLILLAFTAGLPKFARADGVPEPGLVMYGIVRNTAGGNARMTTGTLTWTIQPVSGTAITVSAPLQNINGVYSYKLRVPFESLVGVNTSAGATLPLSTAATSYNRATVLVNGVAASLVSPALPNFTFAASTRAAVERLDVNVAIAIVDSDGDGLPDDWEIRYFENLSRTGLDDFDNDGVSDLNEYLAGTNPNDAQSFLAFTLIKPVGGAAGSASLAGDGNSSGSKDHPTSSALFIPPSGGYLMEWNSASNRVYTILSAPTLSTNPADYTIVKENILATPPKNTFIDIDVKGSAFYLLRLQQ